MLQMVIQPMMRLLALASLATIPGEISQDVDERMQSTSRDVKMFFLNSLSSRNSINPLTPVNPMNSFNTVNSSSEWMNLSTDEWQDLLHYTNLSKAMYAWPPISKVAQDVYDLIEKEGKGISLTELVDTLRELFHWSAKFPFRYFGSTPEDEQKGQDGFLKESGVPPIALRKLSWKNGIYGRSWKIPYVVVADNRTKSIVVAIRGSYSFIDFVFDLVANNQILERFAIKSTMLAFSSETGKNLENQNLLVAESVRQEIAESVQQEMVVFVEKIFNKHSKQLRPATADVAIRIFDNIFVNLLKLLVPSLAEPTQDEGMYAHKGMLMCAMYIVDELMENHFLQNLLAETGYKRVVFTGHSLGAGVAALITRNITHQDLKDRDGRAVEVRGYALSPPGCVISKEGLTELKDQVLSVVLAQDLVGRLSYNSVMEWIGIQVNSTYKKMFAPGQLLHLTPEDRALPMQWITAERLDQEPLEDILGPFGGLPSSPRETVPKRLKSLADHFPFRVLEALDGASKNPSKLSLK